jgi:hypothetical protein
LEEILTDERRLELEKFVGGLRHAGITNQCWDRFGALAARAPGGRQALP